METLELVGLSDSSGTRGSQLSGGQRRRLDVALALIGDPELVFLDEPTTGFDPSARRQAWDVIDGLRQLGKTIFLTTHYMEEAERLADRIMVIARGQIVAEGSPKTLGGRDLRPALIRFQLRSDQDVASLPDQFAGRVSRTDHGEVSIASREPLHDVVRLAEWADSQGVEVRDLEVQQPTLEDIYLELTADRPVEPHSGEELAWSS
jgi:ABC-2 type transport system ATP-binding protein